MRVGFPIRTSADQRSLASPRGFSQRATSFFASWRQGIHRTLLSRSIHHQRPHAGPSPTSKHQQLNQKNAQQLTLYNPTNKSDSPVKQRATQPRSHPRDHGQTAISSCSVKRRAGHHQASARQQPTSMETVGIEPTTPCLQSRCSPTELRPRKPVPRARRRPSATTTQP